MEFRWDANKNKENIRKHGISFEDVAEVFDDPLHVVPFLTKDSIISMRDGLL